MTTRKRLNQDGGVWRLAWARTEAGFRAWVVAHPDVAAEGATWEEVEEAMIRAIDENLQAGEWTADWDPPRPAAEGAPYETSRDYVELCPDGRFEVQGDASDYYTAGVCPLCRSHRGERTATPLRVRIDTLAGIMFTSYRDTIANANLFRRTTLDELGPERLAGAEVRPAVAVGRERAEVLEVIAPSAIDAVAVRGLTLEGRRCPECQMRFCWHHLGMGSYVTVYPRDLVPRDAAAFWVRSHGSCHLCVRLDWWRQHRGAPAFEGVTADGLHVAASDRIDEGAVLPLR